MWDIAPLFNSFAILVMGSFGTFAATWFWTQRANAVKAGELIALGHQQVVNRIADLENKLGIVSAAVTPISIAFQAILVKELTHSHTPEMDLLLTKIGPPNELSEKDDARLRVMLKERSLDFGPLISAAERDAARILPMVMARASAEQIALANPEVESGDLQIVVLPPEDSEPLVDNP
jgi:hypothetical protein